MEDKVTEGVLLKLRDIKEETLQELQDALSLLLSYDILANDSGVQRSVTKKKHCLPLSTDKCMREETTRDILEKHC